MPFLHYSWKVSSGNDRETINLQYGPEFRQNPKNFDENSKISTKNRKFRQKIENFDKKKGKIGKFYAFSLLFFESSLGNDRETIDLQ